MSRSTRLGAMAFIASLSACAAPLAVSPPPPIPVVPVSFESNLLTARQCEYRGVAVSEDDARGLGANLLLRFEASTDTSVAFAASRRHAGPNAVNVAANADMMAKAVTCPQGVVDQIVATNSAVAAR